MSVLGKISKGRCQRPVTICVWGIPGCGKSTFAASAPNPIFFDTEGGSWSLDVSRVLVQDSWTSFLSDLRELVNADHGFKTVVVDTLDALEPLAIQHVCGLGAKKTLADFDYGKGYALLLQEWRIFLKTLETLRDKRGMNIILIAHECRKEFADPTLGTYAMFRPKLQDKVWGETNGWVDAVLFAQFDEALLEAKGERNRAIVSGRRVLRTTRGTGFCAKNRFGLPPTIDLDWFTFEQAAQPVPIETLKARLNDVLAKCSEDIRTKTVAYLSSRGETPETLRAVTERAEKLLQNGLAA